MPSLFVLKEALMILGPWDSHPISAFCAFLDSINATPCVCGAFSSSWPEYNRSSPEDSRCCPTCVQCVSLIPSTSRLYFLISAAIWKTLPVSHIVRTFHVPIKIVALVVRRCIGLMTSEGTRLSSWDVIIIPSTPRAEFKWFEWFFLVSVFLASWFSTGWGR